MPLYEAYMKLDSFTARCYVNWKVMKDASNILPASFEKLHLQSSVGSPQNLVPSVYRNRVQATRLSERCWIHVQPARSDLAGRIEVHGPVPPALLHANIFSHPVDKLV
jgi:hypothetical protein